MAVLSFCLPSALNAVEKCDFQLLAEAAHPFAGKLQLFNDSRAPIPKTVNMKGAAQGRPRFAFRLGYSWAMGLSVNR